MPIRRRDAFDLTIILGVWSAAIFFIRPSGEFPILDDWDFTIATWNFARTGHFHFTAFTAVSLRAMVLWGATWTRLFGQSFLVLRVATLTLSAITITVVHQILRLAALPRVAVIVSTLAFAFHPIFLWSSCTYMTEVPFICASALAFLGIWRGLSEESSFFIGAGCVAALISCFVRQTGIISVAAPLLVIVVLRPPKWRRHAAILMASGAIIAAVLLVNPEWLSGSPSEFASHYKVWHETSFRLPQQIALAYHYFVFNAQNAALFFLPLVIPLALSRRNRWQWALIVPIGVGILWRVQHLVNIGIAMPYFAFASQEDILQGNILTDFGLGPPTLLDTWSLQNPYPFHLTMAGKLIVTYLSVAAATLLVWGIVVSIKRENLALVLSVALAAVGTAALVASGFYSDRYSLDSAWSIGLALAAIVPWEKRSARWLAIVTLATVAIFATLSVQEYFAWNRARWTAYHSLRARGVAITDIDGGSETTNWYEISMMNRDQARKRTMLRPPRQYVIAFGALPGHMTVAQFPFEGWLGFHHGAIHVLKNVKPADR